MKILELWDDLSFPSTGTAASRRSHDDRTWNLSICVSWFGGFHKWGYPQMDGLQWKILLQKKIWYYTLSVNSFSYPSLVWYFSNLFQPHRPSALTTSSMSFFYCSTPCLPTFRSSIHTFLDSNWIGSRFRRFEWSGCWGFRVFRVQGVQGLVAQKARGSDLAPHPVRQIISKNKKTLGNMGMFIF